MSKIAARRNFETGALAIIAVAALSQAISYWIGPAAWFVGLAVICAGACVLSFLEIVEARSDPLRDLSAEDRALVDRLAQHSRVQAAAIKSKKESAERTQREGGS